MLAGKTKHNTHTQQTMRYLPHNNKSLKRAKRKSNPSCIVIYISTTVIENKFISISATDVIFSNCSQQSNNWPEVI